MKANTKSRIVQSFRQYIPYLLSKLLINYILTLSFLFNHIKQALLLTQKEGTMASPISFNLVEKLKSLFSGGDQVIGPNDYGYDQSLKRWSDLAYRQAV